MSWPAFELPTRQRMALVIEDEPSMRELIVRALGELELGAVSFGSGEAALAWTEAHPAPDLVSLDLVLPWMCGLRVCDALRTSERTQHVPIIVVTGRTEMQDEAAALEVGADAFLEKPFRMRDFLAEVRRLTGVSAPVHEGFHLWR